MEPDITLTPDRAVNNNFILRIFYMKYKLERPPMDHEYFSLPIFNRIIIKKDLFIEVIIR